MQRRRSSRCTATWARRAATRCRPTASGGYYLSGKSEQDLAAECAGYVDAGFTAVKIKVGRVDARADAGRIATVRAAVGDEVELFADANNAWPDAASAIRAIRRWDEYDLGWVEEPNPPDELAAHAAVAAAVEPPIATGEIHQTRWDFQHILDLAAAAILQPDAAVCGGITEFRRIAALAAGQGITVAPHWLADLHVHLVAATPNATWVEYFPDTEVLNLMELFQTRLAVRGRRAGATAGAGPRHRARRRRRATLRARRLALSGAHLDG